jgi:secreted trypsin-like serine protease
MVVSDNSSYLTPRYRVSVGDGYDGVVRISAGGYYGSGVLLYGGTAVLTAAHLFYPSISASDTTVYFSTVDGDSALGIRSISVFPSYEYSNSNNDLAILLLSESAPLAAERYEIYRDFDEIGTEFTAIGYGRPGIGTTGSDDSYRGDYLKLKIKNSFDADPSLLKSTLGSAMAWNPLTNTQLAADFDNGSSANDALGILVGLSNTGLGSDEGMIASGDSGGPAFIGSKLAAIASYIASLSSRYADPDINSDTDSSYGEIGFWQRVSSYQEWIDKSIRAQYPDAPTSSNDVQKSVAEGSDGVKFVYFLVEFNGDRANASDILSVDYHTRDGSAKASEDYIEASGTLNLYSDESKAVIAVEILGDTLLEADELFYLDVSNPVGGSFADNATVLTVARVILNDDGVWLG